MKEILKWLNPNIRMKRWLLVIFIGAIMFGFAISNLIIYSEISIGALLVTGLLFVFGGTLILLSYMLAQTKLLQLITGINVMNESDSEEIQKMFRDKNIYEENPKITIIGSGIQINNIIQSVKKYSNNIDVILPFYEMDIKNAIINLSTQKDLMEGLFEDNYMFSQIEKFKKTYGDYEKGLNALCSVFSMNGNVIPLTFDDIDYSVTLSDGVTVNSNDDFTKINQERGTTIENITILNTPKLTKTAATSIKTSDIIIFAPCRLYSELLPMLLVDNLYEKIKKSKAKKVYLNSIMTIPGETTFYDLYDHIDSIRKITGIDFIDYAIVDKGNVEFKKMAKELSHNSSEPVKYDKNKFDKEDKIKVIKKYLAVIENDNIVYDIKKTSNLIADILVDNEIKEGK